MQKVIFTLLLIAMCITVSLLSGIVPAASAATPELAFNDLEGFEWAADALAALEQAGIIQGDDSGNFNPGGNITRAQFARVLCLAFKLTVDNNAPSSFSGDSAWNAENGSEIPYIEAAKQYFYYSGNTFNPDGTVTREQIAFSLVKVLDLDTSSVNTSEAKIKYTKDWPAVDNVYKPAVALATTIGFLTGDGNGRFNPTDEVKRAEIAVLLYRALNYGGGVGGVRFSDVKPGDWYYIALMNLVNRGVVNGYQDGTFRPDDVVKNSDLPWIIARILYKGNGDSDYDPAADSEVTSKLPGDFNYNSELTREVTAYTIAKLCKLAIPADVNSVLSRFSDDTDIVNYRKEIASVVDAGYMNGIHDVKGNLVFNPNGPVTRAEMAVLMVKALPTRGSCANVSHQVFSDVTPSDWYYDGIMNLYNRGDVNGYEDGSFRPDEQLGDEIAGFIAYRHLKRAWFEGYDPTNDPLVLGYFPNNTFTDTKEASAYAILKMLDIDTSDVNSDAILAKFNDKGQISEPCKPTLAYLVSVGALKGDENGNLSPKEKITRGEFAVFYARVLNGVDKSKMNDYENTIEAVKNEESTVKEGFAASMSAGTEKTVWLEEDWRLTSALDINAGSGNVLIIDGQNKYDVYEMNTSARLKNSTGAVRLQNVRIINAGKNPAAGSLAELSQAASAITSVAVPAKDATKLIMPAAAGFTVSIKSSSNEEIIAKDGTITSPESRQTVNLVFTLSGSGCEADTVSIPVTIPAFVLDLTEWVNKVNGMDLNPNMDGIQIKDKSILISGYVSDASYPLKTVLVNVSGKKAKITDADNDGTGEFSYNLKLKPGKNEVVVTASDPDSSASSDTYTIYLCGNKVPKVIIKNVLDPDGKKIKDGLPQNIEGIYTLQGTVSEPATVYLHVNGQKNVNESDDASDKEFSIGVELKEGINALWVEAVGYTNDSSDSSDKKANKTVIIDVTPPDVSEINVNEEILSGDNIAIATKNNKANITGVLEDNITTESKDFTVIINNKKAKINGSTFSGVIGLNEGDNLITLEAYDKAGNNKTITFTIYKGQLKHFGFAEKY
ncbi:MAG: S-layer protein precursor [Pelotomaculum sp. PtaU1.Bin035]|nr:MAG: S-layer protein precursor [Pelotomaculum sp. PtaU1.Bin035]